MGAVYLAQQARPSRYVAVKVLFPRGVIDNKTYNEFLTRFRREADLIARLEHINIVPIYEYGEQDGLAYLVMPNLTGGSLRNVLAQRGALPLARAQLSSGCERHLRCGSADSATQCCVPRTRRCS